MHQAFDVVRGAGEGEVPRDLGEAAQFALAQPGNRFEPVEDAFDARPTRLTESRRPHGASYARRGRCRRIASDFN
jgi:hypothetical protein